MGNVYVFGSGGLGGVRGLGLGITNPAGTGGVCNVCLCLGCGVAGVRRSGWVAWFRVWDDDVVLCLSVL